MEQGYLETQKDNKAFNKEEVEKKCIFSVKMTNLSFRI